MFLIDCPIDLPIVFRMSYSYLYNPSSHQM